MTREEFFKHQPPDKRTEDQYEAALWFRKKFHIPESMPWNLAKELITTSLEYVLDLKSYD